MSFEVTITNPGLGSQPFIIDVDVEAPKRPVDAHRYSTFQFTCPKDVPIAQYAWVKVKDNSTVLFRGYVFYYKIEGYKRTVQCRGEEELLMHRYTARHGYQSADDPAYTISIMNLSHVFEDNEPHQTADIYGCIHNTGLIYLANSQVPWTPWTWVSNSPYVWALLGGGTNSRIGTANLFIEGKLLTRQSSYANLIATTNSCFGDANNLFINIDYTSYQTAWNCHISATNFKDTHVRIGTLNKATEVLDGNLQLCDNRIADVLINMAIYYVLTPHWRYTDSYTYLDCIDES